MRNSENTLLLTDVFHHVGQTFNGVVMDEGIDPLVLTALRAMQIAFTGYAIWLVWRWRRPRDETAGILLPLLAILLVLSVANLGHAGRLAADPDLIWWAWTLYDLAIPLTVIRLVGHDPICWLRRAGRALRLLPPKHPHGEAGKAVE